MEQKVYPDTILQNSCSLLRRDLGSTLGPSKKGNLDECGLDGFIPFAAYSLSEGFLYKMQSG